MKLNNRVFLVAVAGLLATLGQALVITDGDGASPSDGRGVSAELFSDLEELARLVDISYCVGSTGVYNPFKCLSHCDEFEGFKLVTTWNTGPLLSDSCGYIALSHPPYAKRIIVAFRGTYSLANTIVDLSTVPQEYVPYPADGDDDEIFTASDNTKKCDNCTVHSGFWSSWKNSRSTILPAILLAKQENPDYQVVLVGHSLGGAVAALAGLELSLRGLDPQVTTFGEPKVGNGEFAEFINAAFRLDLSTTSSDRYRRVTHVNDPVPLLPLKEWGYASHAGEIYISKLSLPPSITDLEVCEGNEDERCLAGVETADSLEHMTTQTSSAMIQIQQNANEMQMQLSLIPAKYRLWELFFSHRDYFWRIGLCVPGGDPGSWRW
ncbi:uncharacterized protein TRUGW13939_09792 [Talaromyces rugulosus]|uniref:Fungal lipase-type domain-containing protein n=1 Tax=Talaromyces rugulosus TaxID=121627 RepID=A0A7H8RA60_TALRU|nr:uncharacterized protein TRUGW13939_09792 [Talaromyces rugulosus]QKX62631.1 hypothetical protein TRUGW13939_09792 [Talaromyces rugulosus]